MHETSNKNTLSFNLAPTEDIGDAMQLCNLSVLIRPSDHIPDNHHDRRAKHGEVLRCCACLHTRRTWLDDREIYGRKTQTNNNTPHPLPQRNSLKAARLPPQKTEAEMARQDPGHGSPRANRNPQHPRHAEASASAMKRPPETTFLSASPVTPTTNFAFTTTTTPTISDGDSLLNCAQCDRTFNSRIGLVGHLRIHHMESVEPVSGAPTYNHRALISPAH
ncbi:unnamed protein product [Schistocephalus solidus]|uniref:C2H2-type domain-containing protein n=1 Tax=Schistocephalus solidus TaxID=70667 RepID=A0A183T1R2_SCHSO|nr:unnamed protein product [Schistocephalus solidus]